MKTIANFAGSSCPIDYEPVSDQWCYRKSGYMLTWHQSMSQCQALHAGSLVEIQSGKEQIALQHWLSSDSSKNNIYINIILKIYIVTSNLFIQ